MLFILLIHFTPNILQPAGHLAAVAESNIVGLRSTLYRDSLGGHGAAVVLAAVVGAAHEAARAVLVRVAVAAAQVAGGGGGAAAVLGLATHGDYCDEYSDELCLHHRPLAPRHSEGSSSWRRSPPPRTRVCSSGGRTSALYSDGVTPVS